jgi:hypothetical protein
MHVAVALLASAEAYTPTAQRLIDGMRERLGSSTEVANALADNLPAPKQHSGKSRRRRRKKKQRDQQQQQGQGQNQGASDNAGKPKRPRRPRPKPSEAHPEAASSS